MSVRQTVILVVVAA